MRDPNYLLGRVRRAAVAHRERSDKTSQDTFTQTLKAICDYARHQVTQDNTVSIPNRHHFNQFCMFAAFGCPPVNSSLAKLEAVLCMSAIYLGDRSYIEHLIAQGWQFCNWGTTKDVTNDVFRSAFQAAATRGYASMKRLLLASNPNYNPNDILPFFQLRAQLATVMH
ncbi:hypothetical protein F5Y09DRAFT_353579 [Xylaria sp. FL1042]|nr:hypothetical protein F5Y09DRAFT_353579 [Xylaria sp. FL1042]